MLFLLILYTKQSRQIAPPAFTYVSHLYMSEIGDKSACFTTLIVTFIIPFVHITYNPYAMGYSITFSLVFYDLLYKMKPEIIELILRISTFVLKSNDSLAPLLNASTSSLSMSITPAVSIPKYCTLEYG